MSGSGGRLSISAPSSTDSLDWGDFLAPEDILRVIVESRIRKHDWLLPANFTSSSKRHAISTSYAEGFLHEYIDMSSSLNQADQFKELPGGPITEAQFDAALDIIENFNPANGTLYSQLKTINPNIIKFLNVLQKDQFGRFEFGIIDTLNSAPDYGITQRAAGNPTFDTMEKRERLEMAKILRNRKFFNQINIEKDQDNPNEFTITKTDASGNQIVLLTGKEAKDPVKQTPLKPSMIEVVISPGLTGDDRKQALMQLMHLMISSMQKNGNNTLPMTLGDDVNENIMMLMMGVGIYSARVPKTLVAELKEQAKQQGLYPTDDKVRDRIDWLEKYGETYSARLNPEPDANYGPHYVDHDNKDESLSGMSVRSIKTKLMADFTTDLDVGFNVTGSRPAPISTTPPSPTAPTPPPPLSPRSSTASGYTRRSSSSSI
jgi:hypothetical protein